jgi:hypothetical protein
VGYFPMLKGAAIGVVIPSRIDPRMPCKPALLNKARLSMARAYSHWFSHLSGLAPGPPCLPGGFSQLVPGPPRLPG